MSSSHAKSRLKASREAIQAKDWQAANEAASDVLEFDPTHYHALVFKALAQLNVNQDEESERLYNKAIELQPAQPLAWQGLEKLYRERERWTALADVLERQMTQAAQQDDVTKCAECLQRLVDLQRQHGTRSDLITSLSFYLPQSSVYDTLSELAVPDQGNPLATTTFDAQMAMHADSLKVLLEVIGLNEQEEKDQIDKEVEKRKNRLDSISKSREALRNDIGLQIWRDSPLPTLYEQVLSHVNADDDCRRDAEHRLLLYRLNLLKALPNPASGATASSREIAAASDPDAEKRATADKARKLKALEDVRQLASGIVAIDVADEVAWDIVIEWQDTRHLSDLDRQKLRALVHHFPRSGLAYSSEALLLTLKDEQFLRERKEAQMQNDTDIDKSQQPDPLNLALDGIEQAPQSLLTHRVLATLYLIDKDWSSASDIATASIQLARRLEQRYAIDLSMVRVDLEAILTTCLTFIHPPQHHARAARLCDSVLAQDPNNVDALMSAATIAQTAHRWDEAKTTLTKVQQINQEDLSDTTGQKQARHKLSPFTNVGREARSDIAWCDIHLSLLDEAEGELRSVIDELSDDPSRSESDEAKVWWRLGYCLWQMDGERRTSKEGAFSCFITALKKDPTFAPAFTSLGFFYADVAAPPDLQRASKCFQKAFELDARENEAALKLAEMYAAEEDWDLVDLVSRRTIEAEGGGAILSHLSGKRSDAGIEQQRRRHTTANAWAWNAIGSTELVRGNFENAIIALQVALRSFPNKQEIWMRLGDAYAESGRQSAAIKTYERAFSLQSSDEQWQATFSIANVQRDMGLYREALGLYESIGKHQSHLVDIQITTAETRLCLARQEAREGYNVRARMGMQRAVLEGKAVLAKHAQDASSSGSALKVIADGLVNLAFLGSNGDCILSDFVVAVVKSTIHTLAGKVPADDGLPAVSSITSATALDAIGASMERDIKYALLMAAAYICKVRVILMTPEDEEVSGSAWMDLSTTLHACVNASSSATASVDVETVEAMQSQAISCAAEALKLEPGRGAFWNSLGVLVFSHGVALAQHCFIRSTECEGGKNDVSAWTNLGLLYLTYDDHDLASSCLVHAQAIDPDYVQAWVGQAILAHQRGEQESCNALFRHAFAIDQGNLKEAAYGFASTTFERQSGHKGPTGAPSFAQLHLCASALASYLAQSPSDVNALHLSALFAEQLGESDFAAEQIERAAKIVEKAYEDNESRQSAQQFAICQLNVGRIRLASGKYQDAIDGLDMALSLLEGDGESQGEQGEIDGEAAKQADSDVLLSEQDVRRARLGAHFSMALAYCGLGQLDTAVDTLHSAMEEAQEEDELQRLATLLAQIYYDAARSDDAEAALMEHIADCPQSTIAVVTLGALSWVTKNHEQLEAVIGDLASPEEDAHGKGGSKWEAKEKAILFSALMSLDQGQAQRSIEILRDGAESSLSIRARLVETLLRIVARKVSDGTCTDEHMKTLRKEANAYYDAIVKNPGGEGPHAGATDALAQALRYKSVAAVLRTMNRDENENDVDRQAHAVATKPPYQFALQAVRVAPLSTDSWQMLNATLGSRGP